MAIDPCPAPAAPVKGVVRFVPADFKVAFPEFASIADARLTLQFNNATLLLNNSCGSYVCDAPKREHLLNLLTAHLAALFDGVNGAGATGAVGRVASATEGTVSAQLEMPTVPNAAWYQQTQWGALYWTATAMYRSFVYVAPPPVCADMFDSLYGPGPGCEC